MKIKRIIQTINILNLKKKKKKSINMPTGKHKTHPQQIKKEKKRNKEMAVVDELDII